MVVFLLDWIMATHLKASFHHQSMRKWGVNTLVFIQHSFIFLPEAKAGSTAQRDQLIYRIFFKALKNIVLFLTANKTNNLSHIATLIISAQTCFIFINYMTFNYSSCLILKLWRPVCNLLQLRRTGFKTSDCASMCPYQLKELVMERHQEVCNASSQHEVPSK